MSAKIIDGKKLAESIRDEIAKEVENLKKEKGITPGLAVILVGDHEASRVYVRNKEAACKKVGFFTEQHDLPASVAEAELLRLIDTLNRNPKIHGILVQLPLPSHLNSQKVLRALDPAKDADGFHPVNLGNLLSGNPGVVPCTPLGIIKMIESTGIPIEGKEAVVVGRSVIVGKPVALLLMQKNATVTICHTKTRDLDEKISRADIVVAAAGRPNAVKGVKKGAIVIDVGINRLPNGKLVGDVEFEEAKKNAAYITPVPGGVGPMTIAMLLSNTLQAAKRSAL